jgi:retinol dehydrogenase 12
MSDTTQIADLSQMNVVITGASTGIGLATAAALAKQKARLFLAGRNAQKHAQAIAKLTSSTGNASIEFIEVDFADLATVKPAAQNFLAKNLPLHVLINNAGLAAAHSLSKQGFELTFAVNHLAPFLFTQLLKPTLDNAKQARVVNVASRASEGINSFSLEHVREVARSRGSLKEYAHSKLANVLFTVEAGRRWAPDGIHSYALHPGVIASDIWRMFPWPLRPLITAFMKSTEQGAIASVRCATDPALAEHNGRYYGEDGNERRANPLSSDRALAELLWTKSDEWVRPFA